MEIYTKLIKCKSCSAVALGFFDGVHKGHRRVIDSACRQSELKSIVFTFFESPMSAITGVAPQLLTTQSYKLELLEKLGVNKLYQIPFEEIRNLSCEAFVKEILVDTLNAKTVFCGFNYSFGYKGAGDEAELKRLCAKYGVKVYTLAPVMFKGEVISSTRIRGALKQGDMTSVNTMLGRCFCLDFEVKNGNKLGRRLGFPTLNQVFPHNFILPRFGVYASAYESEGKIYPAVTNIGIKPTIGSEMPLAETWVPDIQLGDLYGKKVHVFLLSYLREEKKFNTTDELKNAVFSDALQAKKIYETIF